VCYEVQASEKSAPQGLDPSGWEELVLVKKQKVNHDSILVRLGFKDTNAVSGLTIASCLLLKAPIGATGENGMKKDVIRPYTPVSDPETRCAVSL
jgi:cytochrome-b5 reductase